jgi:DNA-directed RNA polymerase specialized sigma subunit
LSWVLEAVKERGDRSLDAGDLFQEGTIGLMRAIDDYDASGREDFEGYARQRILEQMDAALALEDAAAEEASGVVKAAEQYERAEQAVRNLKGRRGTDEEVAGHLKWSVARTSEVRQIVDAARRHHDEEILPFLDPEDVTPDELRRLLDERERD